MSATLTGTPQALFTTAAPERAATDAGAARTPPGAARHAPVRARSATAGGRPATLEARLAHAWHELAHAGQAECPVCDTAMRLESGAGRCTSCGTTLS
jgi:hypothetical protein